MWIVSPVEFSSLVSDNDPVPCLKCLKPRCKGILRLNYSMYELLFTKHNLCLFKVYIYLLPSPCPGNPTVWFLVSQTWSGRPPQQILCDLTS